MDFIEFEDNGRTMTCRSASFWWWLAVSGESQRYAAFRTQPSDTAENLRPRIVAYYEQLLADRMRPREFQPRAWGRTPKSPPGTPATGEA